MSDPKLGDLLVMSVLDADNASTGEISDGSTSIVAEVDDVVDIDDGPRRMAAIRASRGSVRSQSVGTLYTFLRGVIPVGTSS